MKLKLAAIAVLTLSISAWPIVPNASSAFDNLKLLAGEWQSKDPSGKTQDISWKLVSAGSVMMESMQENSMITMYYLDKDRLMLTHYCAAQNQPRMQAQISDDGKTFTFDFRDVTNLTKASPGHMHKMVLTIHDKDHISEHWYFRTEGKDDEHGAVELTRKK